MRRRKSWIVLVTLLCLLAATTCRTGPPPEDINPGPADGTFAQKNARDLFDFPRVPVFKVVMPPEEWSKLKAHCRDEQYVPADAWFEGAPVGKVGIRFKGAVGSLESCFDKDGKFICRKLSMKIKFDEYDRDNRFYGLKRLNFHGYRWDHTYMKERLAYDLFRSMGIVAPRAAWAKLIVNNEVLGLFGMVEQVDGRFTADRWPENPDGNLYKEAWPGGTDRNWILAKLETNKTAADIEAFLAFSRAINAAAPGELRGVLGRFVDLDYLARYMVVDDGIANLDGVTAYYVSLDHQWEGAGNHNYYFYQSGADKFTIIPWDLESTFYLGGGFSSIPRWTGAPRECLHVYYVWDGKNTVIAPGCDRVFRALAADLGGYRAACRKFLDGPFGEQAMVEAVDRHASFIREAVKADPNGPGPAAFEGAVSFLKKQIPLLRLRLESFLSGEPGEPVEIPAKGRLDFERNTHAGLRLGTLLLSNPNTTASVAINAAAPLSGKQDLLYAFRFSDEKANWGQWTFYQIPVAPGNNDLTRLTGIRMLLRADGKRMLRVDLDGPGNPDPEQGIRYGWDVGISENPELVEVRFDEASLVPWAKKKGKGVPAVLNNVTGVMFAPQCRGRTPNGRLGKDATDNGFIRIDDIEFF